MASKINYSRAAQVAIIAVGADLCFNQGRTISGIALGSLGSCAIEKAKQVRPYFSIRPLDNINPRYASK
jgi:hypothetical protein